MADGVFCYTNATKNMIINGFLVIENNENVDVMHVNIMQRHNKKYIKHKCNRRFGFLTYFCNV